MLKNTRILVGFEYDPPSRAALAEAIRLARASQSELVLVHAFPPAGSEGAPVAAGDREKLCDLLDCEADYARSFEIPTRVVCADGEPAAALLETIDIEAPDLVVVGTHGRTGLDKLIMGSIATQIVRGSRRPVLVVRDPRRPSGAPIAARRVVVGVDFTAPSTAALGKAAALAKLSGAPLTLIHVLQPSLDMEGEPGRTKARLEDAAREPRAAGISCTCIVVRGDPEKAILAEAEGDPESIIVVGTRLRSEASRFAFGSVAEGILRRAPCPVLVAHAGEPRFELVEPPHAER